MRTLFIGALAASLVGCSCFVSPQAGVEACVGADGNGLACFDRITIAQSTEEPRSSDTDPARPRIKSKVAAKVQRSLTAHGREKTQFVMQTAKPTATTAKPEDPASAEFSEMPAMRTNTLGQSVDTICGRVRGKKASGERTEDDHFCIL